MSFVGVQAAFHEQLRLAFVDHLYGPSCSCFAVRGIDEFERSDVQIVFPSDGLDPLGRTDKNRNEQTGLDRLEDTAERVLVARVHDGAPHG
jgi:hypothetical protein